MGHVVSFTPRQGGQSKPIEAGQAAAIIIFPGVRYERVPENPAPAHDGRKTATARRRSKR